MMVWDLMWSKSPFWALLPVIDYQYVQSAKCWWMEVIELAETQFAIDYGTTTGNLGPKRFLLVPLACSGPVAWAK